MNRIQLISMWCGIAVIVYVGLAIVCSFDFGNMGYFIRFCLLILLVVLVTGGMIYTFRGKKDKKPKDE